MVESAAIADISQASVYSGEHSFMHIDLEFQGLM
jgi:hypothetical protein